MKQRVQHALHVLLTALLISATATLSSPVSAQAMDFSFGVIGQVIKTPHDDSPLAQAIAESDTNNLAFVVANGFKRADESCSDQLYQRRRDLLDSAKNGLILSLASGDWGDCRDASGRSAAVERLSRLRELFFVDEFSLGASKIPVMRQSNALTFRSYVENARWELGNILFAAINLPADNNRYRMEAGRNSEFEDRQIANRDWLRRIFAIATRKKMAGIVLLCDGNPLLKPNAQRLFDSSGKRDGFAEIRQQLISLAGKFPGKVLIIHNRPDSRNARPGDMAWHGNLGDLELGSDWIRLGVKQGNPLMFTVTKGSLDTKETSQ
jgi:hypothetical protein